MNIKKAMAQFPRLNADEVFAAIADSRTKAILAHCYSELPKVLRQWELVLMALDSGHDKSMRIQEMKDIVYTASEIKGI